MQGNRHGTAPAIPADPAPAGANTARVIAIVGAGFSGLTLAIRLLRQPQRGALRIELVEPRAELGAGVAYATRDYPYPLNVAAGNMSIDSARPHDFLDYLDAAGIRAVAGDYLPRQVYGEYLRARFAAACDAAPQGVQCVQRSARALQLRRATGGGWELWLDDGSALRADDVVLAIGNSAPTPLPALGAIARAEAYIHDPWSIGAPAHREIESVVLIGSGLTMIDAALRLAAIRPRVRHIHVLSRHGLLPLPQATSTAPAINPDLRAALAATHGSLRRIVRALRRSTREVAAAGGDWREVVALVRAQLPALWQGLARGERLRFLRHARAYWDVHRHRVPAGPLNAVRALQRLGVLEINAGRIEEAIAVDGGLEVHWRERATGRVRAWIVDRVVNCTGPANDIAGSTDPLVRSLLSTGLIRRDGLALGLDVAPDGCVIAASGTPVDGLYYIGPWLRARDWEATAVPELREHAAQLAQLLTERAYRVPEAVAAMI